MANVVCVRQASYLHKQTWISDAIQQLWAVSFNTMCVFILETHWRLLLTDAHLKVMCSKDHVAIRAAEAFFEYHGVPLESLHLPNKSCGAKREHIDGVPYYVFRVSKHKYLTCGGLPFEVQLEHNSFNVCVRLEKDEHLNVWFLLLSPYRKI